VALAPVVRQGTVDGYVIKKCEIPEIEQVVYFGASIFWKSSLRSWDDGVGALTPIELGPYQERLRCFLLGQELFPSGAAMIVQVSGPTNRLIDVVAVPSSDKSSTHYVHHLYVRGLAFRLVVGRRMARYASTASASKPWPKVILVSQNQEEEMVHLYTGLLSSLARNSIGKCA
jgi:hypothetical protein